MPRSVVIKRRPAREILLSLSPRVPGHCSASGQVVQRQRRLDHTCVSGVCVARSREYMHVCVCVKDLARAHRQHQARNKIQLLFSAADRPRRNSFKRVSVAVNAYFTVFNDSEYWKHDRFYKCISIRISVLYKCVLPQRPQTRFEKTELLSVFSLPGPSTTNNYCSFQSLPCAHALLTQIKK